MTSRVLPSPFRRTTSLVTVDSTPSLIFTDTSSEDMAIVAVIVALIVPEQDEPEQDMEKQDVSAVMTKALGHLDHVAEHLREKGENDAANQIAKQTINIVNTFTDVTASWDIEKCLMTTVNRRDLASAPNRGLTGAAKSYVEGSWAAIAATATTDNNRLVKFGPSDALKTNVTVKEEVPQGQALDMRVVWLQPWDGTRPFSDATKELTGYGPLLSVAYSEPDNALCIIFQHAYPAQTLLKEQTERLKGGPRGMFGPQVHVMLGQAYPKTDDLCRMGMPLNERRRLTFARHALFVPPGGVSEDQFKRDIFAVVGEQNVELIWLFNSGNATVVFSATVIARLVRDTFLRFGKTHGPYRDIQIGFSQDPCEKPLHLVTQLPPNSYSNSRVQPVAHQANANHIPLGPASQRRATPGASHRRTAKSATGEDGWQTVVGRRNR